MITNINFGMAMTTKAGNKALKTTEALAKDYTHNSGSAKGWYDDLKRASERAAKNDVYDVDVDSSGNSYVVRKRGEKPSLKEKFFGCFSGKTYMFLDDAIEAAEQRKKNDTVGGDIKEIKAAVLKNCVG